ncbi:MAG: alpha/beta fold hydrolase [Pseudomonadota bacterium]|nr:alpha/beta fold hydrolase [Pseudomonadota bacterium]
MSKPGLGTFLPQEGGPGYSSTGTRDNFLALFAPLRDRRDVLIIDKRGTGGSQPVDCHALQYGSSTDPAALKACGRELGSRADIYGTALAVADMVAVLDALEIDSVDFYGDSYGTFFGQVFAARYPTRVRSLVLDGTYPVRVSDVWFPTDYTTALRGIDLTCERTAECNEFGGRASARIAGLVDELREHPIAGIAPDANGQLQPVTVDPSTLYAVIANAGYAASVYRELDAAVRGWFQAGDALPILRLAAEYNTSQGVDPSTYSAGLFTAVSCSDYPLLFNLSAPPATRRRQLDAAIESTERQRPRLYAPFTITEALGSSANINPLALCLDWPAPSPAYPQGQSIPPGVSLPGVPTLILNGEFDSVTSPEDGRQTARQFPKATQIIIPNQGHVTALDTRTMAAIWWNVRRESSGSSTPIWTSMTRAVWRACDRCERSLNLHRRARRSTRLWP